MVRASHGVSVFLLQGSNPIMHVDNCYTEPLSQLKFSPLPSVLMAQIPA